MTFKFGYVTLIGRPNVGKSTLMNRLVGRKISITSPRPQTTRHRILGIRSTQDSQIVFVDTPGFDQRNRKAIGRVTNRTAVASVTGIDAIVFVIEAIGWRQGDDTVCKLLRGTSAPVIMAINKIDRMAQKQMLLPLIDRVSRAGEFADVIPLSAKTAYSLERLLIAITRQLPVAEAGFPAEQLTDRSDGFIASELIREQLFRQLGEELPYLTAVELTAYRETGSLTEIDADIWVDRPSHKAIVIGNGGKRLKQIGSRAREQLERFLGKRVHVKLWVKVRSGWMDSRSSLAMLGYHEDNW